MQLSQLYLRKIFKYDPDVGDFTRIAITSKKTKIGQKAGCPDDMGYLLIRINKKLYRSHRLAWFYTHGAWPNQIDHINGVRTDNRIVNLRDVSSSVNSLNQCISKLNKSGVTGVYFQNNTKKWVAQINGEGKKRNLGCFVDWFDAVCCRKSAEVKYGYHANHGRPK